MYEVGTLRLEVSDVGSDDTCRLGVILSSNGFRGEGYAWFNLSVLQEFATALAAFPISASDPPHLVGGFGSFDGRPTEVHVELRATQADDVGHILIEARLAALPNIRREERNELVAHFATGYQELTDLSDGIRYAVATRGGVVEVLGHS